MSEAKLISYTLNDFSTEIEMESFLHFMEKHGDEMYKKLKNFQKKHEDYFNKINIKRTSSRSINMLDFNY